MVMSQRMILIKTFLFSLALSSAFAWSQKKAVKKNSTEPSIWVKSSALPSRVTNLETQESKPKPRYAGHPPAAGEEYILEEDDGHLGGPEGEFVDEEGREEHSGQGQERGYHNDDKKVNDETKKDFKQAGAYQDFSQGGAVFDKHHKDHIAENKANENVNEHDAGEKFGAEALKEHKNGKHKEKSKGHKKYGFKNVYHKEEYGDHKTFHDEFLDNDHFHDYDDQHEHKQMQGGRFSKGYKRSGENKEHDVGDEKHAWGKAGHDGHADGHYEKGGHLLGHHHGHKKKEGHFDANSRHVKASAHKLKKGDAPDVGSHYDQPQYYDQVYHDNQAPLHPQEVHYEDQHARHNRGQYVEDSVPKVQVGNGYPNDEVLHQRTTEGRRLEVPSNEKQIPIDFERIPVKETHHLRESVHSTAEPKLRSFHYVRPNTELRDQILEKGNQNNKYQQQYDHVVPAINPSNSESDRINKYRQHYELSEPRRPLPHHHHLSASQPVKYDPSLQHSFTSAGQSNLQSPRHPMPESQFHHQPRKVNRHRHFLINPHHQQGVGSHLHQESHRPHQHAQSKPYPWWEHSGSPKHQPSDSHLASSYQHFGYVGTPQHTVPWRSRQHHLTGDDQMSGSKNRPRYVRMPDNVHLHNSKKDHRHHQK